MLTDAGSRAVWLKVCVAISWLLASRRCTVAQLLPEPPDTNHVKGTLHLRGGAAEERCGCRTVHVGAAQPPTHMPRHRRAPARVLELVDHAPDRSVGSHGDGVIMRQQHKLGRLRGSGEERRRRRR